MSCIYILPVITYRSSYVLLYPFLGIPELKLFFFISPLLYFIIGLQIKNCSYLRIFNQLININFKKRIWSNNNIELFFVFKNFVENEPCEEWTICFFYNSIDNIDFIVDFPIWCLEFILFRQKVFVRWWIIKKANSMRKSFSYFLILIFFLFNIWISKLEVSSNEVTITSICLIIFQGHEAFPYIDWFSIFGYKPVLI